MKITTIYNDENQALSKKADKIPLTKKGLLEAKKIVDQLQEALAPLMPAAGLAAPQIGISKQVFLYSYDGTAENMEIVINPSFDILNKETDLLWEACFSATQDDGPLKIAYIERYTEILVTYNDLAGKTKKLILENYSARIFQHEYDHLQGIVNVLKNGTIVKEFATRNEFIDFFKSFKETTQEKIKHTPPKEVS